MVLIAPNVFGVPHGSCRQRTINYVNFSKVFSK